ncbi:MAG: hypothetical protein F6J95_015190 [Leptolyngbya sp. SIO1E4]|nr:hypothetical protein [Leptolyngbya sp. SIO1E4]
MEYSHVVQLSAMPGWIIGVSHTENRGYQCWVINRDLDVLSDGTLYTTSSAALTAGRTFVERYA